MKYLFIFFMMSNVAFAQSINPDGIAAMEAKGHQRLIHGAELSFASANFDVKYYRCRWEVDPAVRYIRGEVTMYFTMTAAGTDITLDLMAPLAADSVKQRSNTLSFSQNTNSLQINFPVALMAGVLDSVTIYYKGEPPSTGFGSFVQSIHNGTPVLWTLSEPYGSRDWWPCKNGLDDKADSIDIFIVHPNIYRAASNGLLQSEISLPGNKMITYWKHRYPIASYLVCFAVTNYVVFNNTVQLGAISLPVQTYCYPESLALFQANTAPVLQAMQFFQEKFGEYPFIREKYGHVQFGWGGGMEHQTATFIVTPSVTLMAHELGHQWFGDKLTTRSWQEVWLNEGFATHLALMFNEHKYPANASAYRKIYLDDVTSLPGGSVKVDDTTNVARIFDNRLSYNKAAYLIYMLRFILGDEVFFPAIRKYLDDPALAYGFTSTASLKKRLEAESGKDLTTFFKQWYEGQGYPSYTLKWNMMGSSHVRFSLSQVTSHPSVSFFEMPIALQFKNATQQATIIVNNTNNNQEFIRSIGFEPDTVLIDPEYWIISKNNSSIKKNLSNTGEGLVEISPNPVRGTFQVFLHDFNASQLQLRITNAQGQRVFQKMVPLTAGAEIITVDATAWASGLYSLTALAGDKQIVKQVLR